MSDPAAELPSIGPGHNLPPSPVTVDTEALAEEVRAEVQPYFEEAAPLLALAAKAVIVDRESAEKVIDLAAKIKVIADAIEQARDARMRPFLTAQRLVNNAYNGVGDRLVEARGQSNLTGLRGMVDQFNRQETAKAEAERQRIAKEQREANAKAEAARKAAEEARKAGDSGTRQTLQAMQAQDEAETLARRAEAVHAPVIRSTAGSVAQKRVPLHEITDFRKALGWLIRDAGRKAQLEIEVHKILRKHIAGIGVEALAASPPDIPGVRVWLDTQAGLRRS